MKTSDGRISQTAVSRLGDTAFRPGRVRRPARYLRLGHDPVQPGALRVDHGLDVVAVDQDLLERVLEDLGDLAVAGAEPDRRQ
ncbi:hypothetical protein [Catenuloplanes indicus]|uniref:Uncharacterized protein n=1 Tax=Catenuloplanes indicus TaxID=137267 RepID=A0AAE3W8J9_9ACTN|nr:hypothetical protein [Catenuloplanes indicus]MDQ0370492.1 hypothetical protein [Catenuloplanes indicus]